MAIKVRCKSCQAVLKTKDAMAGKTAKCPHCGGKVRIPDPNNPERPRRPRSSPGSERPQRRRRRPPREDVYEAEEVGGADDYDDYDFGGGDDFDFGGMNPNAGTAVSRPDRKPCPACGEMIQKKAAKCRFCGEIFDPALKRRKKKRKRRRSSYSSDDDLETIEWLLVIFCGRIACILGIIYLIQGNPKGPKMIGYSIAFGFGWAMLYFLFLIVGGAAG